MATVTVTTSFWTEAWRKLKPHALAVVLETGVYLRYWLLVLLAHGAKVVMSASGIEPELIEVVLWMERVVFIASFASFFVRLLMRLWRETVRGKL